jgi:hypothetical protein
VKNEAQRLAPQLACDRMHRVLSVIDSMTMSAP